MSIRILGLCATLSMAAGMSQASTFTLNDMTATCVSGTCTQFSSTVVSDLGVGAVYSLQDPTFVDGEGDPYYARVTIVDESDTVNVSSINIRGVSSWAHYRFDFFSDLSLTTPTVIENIQFINLEDIDSNRSVRGRDNFTDVAGILTGPNITLASVGDRLEIAGFDAGLTDPAPAGFTYVRSKKVDGEWFNVGNVQFPDGDPVDADLDANNPANFMAVAASFEVTGGLSGFDYVWGATGVPSNNVRGFDLSISALPSVPPSPIPLPASLPLLLAGLGGIAALRRARRTA